MWTRRAPLWRLSLSLLLVVSALALAARGEEEVPSEKQCRPYIEKALKELESGDAEDSAEKNDSREVGGGGDSKEVDSGEDATVEDDSPSVEVAEGAYVANASVEDDQDSKEDGDQDSGEGNDDDSKEDGDGNDATAEDNDDTESDENKENGSDETKDDNDTAEDDEDSKEVKSDDTQEDNSQEDENDTKEETDEKDDKTEVDDDSQENTDEDGDSKEEKDNDTTEDDNDTKEDDNDTKEDDNDTEETQEDVATQEDDSKQDTNSKEDKDEDQSDTKEDDGASEDDDNTAENDEDSKEDTAETAEDGDSEDASEEGGDDDSDEEGTPEEDLLKVGEIPENLRSRKHIEQILRLNEEASEAEVTVDRAAEIILRDVKRLYENNIKPLETIYKYRDLSNRHFGDPEIFSKPLVLFMGPWSGGKSTILNYLTGLEFTEWSLRSGAEPSPAYFNILMHGSEPEVLDGTQLAADFTFSGLQKFGQGLEERLRGLKYPSKILEKVNIVEIPGILEVRKQVSRVFPFNDACQWFIDRADIIFLVYDPSKLDVGPETEAILDQLKGRESQTRIVLNKADSVKAEELMRVQSALIWNISPLMSSAQPPAMYTVSLWSMPWHEDTPVRLLLAQEKALLQDLRTAIDRRIENKIASARRFAVRVRNHAKMVDCYLTTYFNHKTIFGNKKLIADAIIENPQNYHIYEGLSTLTNISRYDLPDPETYRDFFRLNPLYEFKPLSSTCTYFRGCPLTKLDVCIAYDLPELVGKYKKMVETSTPQGMPKS